MKNNYWGLSESDCKELIQERELDCGKHQFFYNKIMDEWEVSFDGLYHHIFKSFEDLMSRENEIDFYEYDQFLSDKYQEETITNSKGKIRIY